MPLFQRACEPPPPEHGELAYVLWVAREWHGIEHAEPHSAIDHDLRIWGDDLWECAEKLSERFGEWVCEWPWQRFAGVNEGVSLLLPFALFWQLVTLPFRGSFRYCNDRERLELQHIALVVEKGEWIDP